MKKIFKLCCMLLITACCLTACDNSLSKANRVVGLMQNTVTTITDDLSAIQNLENALQTDFEAVLSQNNLALFNAEDNQVALNVTARETKVKDLITQYDSLTSLIDELNGVMNHKVLPKEHIQTLIGQIQALQKDLKVYTDDYTSDLQLEKQSFAAIANPDADYTAFFEVLSNVNTLAVTNNINLNQLVTHFEKININLVNLKVELVNLGAKDK